MISLCAVLVSTPQARSRIIASSRSHDSLPCSASRPSSTAANATSAPATGLPPWRDLDARDRLLAHRVLRLVARHADLQLVRGDADLERGDAELECRLDKSTIAVGAWYSRPSYRKLRAQATGSRQPQVKNEYHGVSRMRPRSASTLT